jgi:hypothetical protein
MSITLKKNSILILLFLLYFLSISFIPLGSSSSTMQIEVLPPQPISGQNFTISVYDPTITDESPYLTNVYIGFQQKNYTITDFLPNRELEITAPVVHIPTSLTIYAHKEGYNDTNKTITIVPDSSTPARVIITVTSETLVADTYFTLKVTDEFNNPIQNATVSIRNQQGEDTDGLTNETGFIRLRAPNTPEIIVLAQKEGYEEDSVNLWIETTQDSTTALLSHPVTPIVIAVCILIGTIIFVTLKNREIITIRSFPFSFAQSSRKKDIGRIHKSKEKNVQTEDSIKKPVFQSQKKHPFHTSKVEEITITKAHPSKEIIKISTKATESSEKQKLAQYHWFSEKNTIEQKVDDLISNHSSSNKTEDWFKGTSSLRNTIDTTIKQKKKKKTKST